MIFPEDDVDTEVKRYASGYAFLDGLYDEEWLNVFLRENYDREYWIWKSTVSSGLRPRMESSSGEKCDGK